MLGFLIYTLEAGIIFAVLTAIYNGVYAGASYHKWERMYILLSAGLSYLLPILKIRFYTSPQPRHRMDSIVEIVSQSPVDVVTLSHEHTVQSSLYDFLHSQIFDNIIAVVFAVYIAGVAGKLISYVNGIRRTMALRRGSFVQLTGNIRLYRVGINTVAFSFFRNIFLGVRAQSLTDAELRTVISHETNHIRGLHSLDTLVLGFMSVLQWMNPMVYSAQKASRLVCENIADSRVSADGKITDYSRLILRLGIQGREPETSGGKSSGALLSRISRLLSGDSERIRRIRFAATIPLLALLISAYLLIVGMAFPVSTGLAVPVEGKYMITAGFFENQKVMSADGVLYNASHRQLDLAAVPGARIFAPDGARVADCGPSQVTLDLHDVAVTVGGISAVRLAPGDTVSAGQTLGTATDTSVMYLKVISGGKAVNPELVFDF